MFFWGEKKKYEKKKSDGEKTMLNLSTNKILQEKTVSPEKKNTRSSLVLSGL